MRPILSLLATSLLFAVDAAPPSVRVPLSALGVEAGATVAVDAADQMAEAAGVSVPLGRPVRLVWTSQQRRVSHVVTAIDVGNGDIVPTWAADEPKQEAGMWLVVGSASSRSITMAYDRALLNARVKAAQSGGGTTTVTEGPGERTGRTSTSSMVTGGAPRDVVILVPVDASQPVRCWVRIAAKVEAAQADAAPARTALQQDIEADRTFQKLDQVLEQELRKDAPKEKSP